MVRRGMIGKSKAFLVFTVLLLTHLFAQSEPKVEAFALPNGLKVIFAEKNRVPLVHAVLAVNVGARDETDRTNGIVHLLEHMILFGRTASRSGGEKNQELRQYGAYFNAHTDHDMLTLEISVPEDAGSRIPGWLREFAFQPRFLPEEIEGEKKVILEEIRQIEDDPETYSTHRVFDAVFAGHPYGRSLYGTPEGIAALGAEELRQLHRSHFVPANCSLALVGRFDFTAMKRKVTEIFSPLDPSPVPSADLSLAPPMEKKKETKVEMDIEQAHASIGFYSPSLESPDRVAMSVLTYLLGRGRRPLLYQGFGPNASDVYDLNVRFISLKYGGVFIAHIVTRPRSLKSITSSLLSFFANLSSFRFSRSDFLPRDQLGVTDCLEIGKHLLKTAAEDAKEEGTRMAASYAGYLLQNALGDGESFLQRLEKVKSSDLRALCSRTFGGKPYVLVQIVPLRERKDEKQ